MKYFLTLLLILASYNTHAALEYVSQGNTHRVQIDYIQIMPSKKMIAVNLIKINRNNFDVSNYNYVIERGEYQTFISSLQQQNSNAAKKISDSIYDWLINTGRIDNVITEDPNSPSYNRPPLQTVP